MRLGRGPAHEVLPMRSSARNAELETAAAELVHALGGKWAAAGAMCHCPAHEDDVASLSVRVGDKSLLFKCFAGCAGIDIIRAIRDRRYRIPTLRGVSIPPQSGSFSQPMRHRARAIWEDAQPIAGSPGERYLAHRGIGLCPEALRYHAQTPLGSGPCVRFRPAVIVAIRDSTGLVAIQRIFLDPRRPALAGDLAKPKRTLGRPLAGAVMLARPSRLLGLAEGVETALSASILLGIPVWATLGNERLARIAIPDRIERLVLLPDADRAGRLAARRARQAYARDGRAIETMLPWRGHNDWNDLLREEGKGEGHQCGSRPDGQGARFRSFNP